MKPSRRARLDGVRWMVLAVFGGDSRGRCTAIDWLMDDPVFNGRVRLPARRGRRITPRHAV
jgi:hypothetical protein